MLPLISNSMTTNWTHLDYHIHYLTITLHAFNQTQSGLPRNIRPLPVAAVIAADIEFDSAAVGSQTVGSAPAARAAVIVAAVCRQNTVKMFAMNSASGPCTNSERHPTEMPSVAPKKHHKTPAAALEFVRGIGRRRCRRATTIWLMMMLRLMPLMLLPLFWSTLFVNLRRVTFLLCPVFRCSSRKNNHELQRQKE